MRSNFISKTQAIVLGVIFLTATAVAAPKPHVVSFGKWTTVQWNAGTTENAPPITLKIRALLVDGRVREYVLGASHEVTDRWFVVRRVFRVNDTLPEESVAHWQWQRGGWLLVDRTTGRVSPVNLPDFDVVYSATSWYRDYVAYCGVSEDGEKTFAIVAQLNRRKPVLKKALAAAIADNAAPDSACLLPTWQRSPIRVSFESSGGAKQTFAIRGHVVDVITEDQEDE